LYQRPSGTLLKGVGVLCVVRTTLILEDPAVRRVPPYLTVSLHATAISDGFLMHPLYSILLYPAKLICYPRTGRTLPLAR